jgi:hypothetical protein
LATISLGTTDAADQYKEGSLKGVLGFVVVAKDTTAHAPHHRTMTPHKGCNSRIFTAADEALQ